MTTGTPLPAEVHSADRQFVSAITRAYSNPAWPESELTSVTADALRLVRKMANKYTDNSCMELKFEELEAEGRRKFIERLQKGMLAKFETPARRGELFKHISACLSNHLKGVVYKCRFTPKRMGRSVPKKGEAGDYDRSWKPEVSLDSPEASPALSKMASVNADTEPAIADMKDVLTPAEYLVFMQLIEPNDGAMLDAWLDSRRGVKPRDTVSISASNMASGLGLSEAVFSELTETVQAKYRKYMNDKVEIIESPYHQAIATLERVLDLHIPRCTDAKTVARAVTIAARANYEKITPETIDLVKLVGGRPPELDSAGNVKCFGVLWQRNNRHCMQCSLYQSCLQEASACGLGEVAVGANVLPGRAAVRTVSVSAETAEDSGEESAEQNPGTTPMNAEEETLKAFVERRFKGSDFTGGQRYYRNPSKSPGQKVRYIFWLGRKNGALSLRFCKPSDKLAKKLKLVGRYHYLPDVEWSAAEKLIMQHAEETSV